jgi:hypothetical protein
MGRENWPVRLSRNGEGFSADRDERVAGTPAELLVMVWPITVDAWTLTDKAALDQGFRKDVVRIIRRGR